MMRELTKCEVEQVSGGNISGYEGAGAILAVMGAGALAVGTGGIGAVVLGIGFGAAGGLAIAQFTADLKLD